MLQRILEGFDTMPSQQEGESLTDSVRATLARRMPPEMLPKVRVEPGRPALVDAGDHPYFANIREHLTTDEKTYDAAVAPYLADLARSDSDVARGIVRRVIQGTVESRALWPDLAWRLLAAEKEGAFQLDLMPDDRKALETLAAKAPAPPP